MAHLRLASIFSNHMVLQRDRCVPIWGTGKPGTEICATFLDQKKTATVGADGKWRISLDPTPASKRPETLTIESGSETIRFEDILVGEVWIASGQSNMQWTVVQTTNGDAKIADASNWQDVRLLTVDRIAGEEPLDSFPKSTGWCVSSPETVTLFSAVAYSFGQTLNRELGVPIGLVDSSWGGTIAEAWMPLNALQAEPRLKKEIVDPYQSSMRNIEEACRKWEMEMDAVRARTRDSGISEEAHSWMNPDFDDSEWKSMDLPGLWRKAPDMNINGVIWFRKTIEIPENWTGEPLSITIGACDKSDTTWVSGIRVGGLTMNGDPLAWCTIRTYTVPSDATKTKHIVVAVRVHSDMLGGGMTGPAGKMRIRPLNAVEETSPAIRLDGPWKYRVETSYGLTAVPQQPPGPGTPNRPAVLYNSMIRPMIGFAIRGAIWYQGESNANRADQYHELFQTLIRSWRSAWNQGDFPFLFVQLANYRAGNEFWPGLREAQAAALTLPETGMAVTIDIGTPDDIHPPNKEDVGKRLARWALDRTYGIPCVVSGPMFREKRIEKDRIRILFQEGTAEGLEIRGEKGTLPSFQIAGTDGTFVPAETAVENDTLLVFSPSVSRPTSVRYAWWDCPDGPLLFNSAGLPASPFRC